MNHLWTLAGHLSELHGMSYLPTYCTRPFAQVLGLQPEDHFGQIKAPVPNQIMCLSPAPNTYRNHHRYHLKEHGSHCGHTTNFIPNRLLALSTISARLLDSRSATGSPGTQMENTRYIALSHCWRNVGPVSETTIANIQQRRKEFLITALPKSFQDAINITKKLGYGLTWIDRICIFSTTNKTGNANELTWLPYT